MPFKNLFRSSEEIQDGFEQSEREAVVDVLHFCMYADRHIALAEDTMIETVARTLNWDPKISYDYYEGKSTGAVRRALADENAKAEFFESVRTRLPNSEHRSFLLKIANDLMLADGETEERERAALQELKAALAD